MNAVIYTRFSPRPNADSCDSCEKQEERCRAHCDHKAYDVVGVFSDKAVSGGDFDRPDLGRAINALDEETVLVVDRGDRLARDMLVSLTIRDKVNRAGSHVEYADGSPPCDTKEGELFANILAAFAQYERSRIREGVRRGIKRRQANGEHFGRVPVGYKRNPRKKTKLIACQHERHAVQLAREWANEDMAPAMIAKRLTKEHGPFRGRDWSERTVRRVICRVHGWEAEST